MPDDRWEELCEQVNDDDRLPVREKVGKWTEHKLWYWNRYIDITTSAMVGKRQWSGLVYVDLFGGPGVLQRKSGKRIPGSPLIAVNARKPFCKILVCEKRKKIAAACGSRLANSPAAGRFEVFPDDCNVAIHDLVKRIP